MDETAGIYALHSEYLDRYVQVGIAQNRVISVEFPRELDEMTDHELLGRLREYLEGEPDDFQDVDVAMTMPTAHREVFEAVRQVPYGENATVEQIEHMIPGRTDEEDLQRTIREALTDNPTPIFIPTHRVRDGPSGMPAEVVTRLRTLEGL
jgi:methylated-DNA-[protein]-cysteine S-methyltransferase